MAAASVSRSSCLTFGFRFLQIVRRAAMAFEGVAHALARTFEQEDEGRALLACQLDEPLPLGVGADADGAALGREVFGADEDGAAVDPAAATREGVCRCGRRGAGTNERVLKPANSDFEPLVLSEGSDDFKILGKVTLLLRILKEKPSFYKKNRPS